MKGLRLTLQAKVALSLVIFTITPLILALTGYWIVIKPRVEALSSASFEYGVLDLAGRINRHVAETLENLADLENPSATFLDPGNWNKKTGPIVDALNHEIATDLDLEAAALISPEGKILNINSVDSAREPVTLPADLGTISVGKDAWFVSAIQRAADTNKAFALDLTKIPAFATLYGNEGIEMPIIAPLRDPQGKLRALWVHFIGARYFGRQIADSYLSTGTVPDGDIANAYIDIDILDKTNLRLMAFRADSATSGHLLTGIFGTPAPEAEFGTALNAPAGEIKLHKQKGKAIIEGTGTIPGAKFQGLGWRFVYRSKIREAFATAESLGKIVLYGLLGAMTVAIFVGIWFGGTLSKPILAIASRMRSLAEGEIEAPVPHAARGDDIGQMAQAVLRFRDAALEKQQLEFQASEAAELAAADRRQAEAERAARADELKLVVSDLAAGLEHLSQGEMTYRLDRPFAPDYEQLRRDFNGAMERLLSAMKAVADNVQLISSGSTEIVQASDDLAKRTEQQAASLEETAAALDQITATVRKTSEGTGHARDIAANARKAAESGGEIVVKAVKAMSEIERSSKEIAQIIGVIDEIAFQTNLLALNAGVEAARAGEAGRGFAVVATEVRALAQRSASAAQEIKVLIATSASHVGNGVELVNQTGSALSQIAREVIEINGVVAEIASSAQEQATGLAEVNTALNQMDQMTQQNAAMVEQSTAASFSLAQEAQELAKQIGRFDVGSSSAIPEPGAVKPGHPGSAVIALPDRRGQQRLPSTKPPEFRTSSARPDTGNAAPAKISVVNSDDGWEEF